MIEIIQQAGQNFAKVRDLKKWDKNPRDVRGEDIQRLKRQLELGEHSALLITPEGEVLGGNTRLRAYRETGKDLAKVIVVEFKKKGKKYEAYVDGVPAARKFDSPDQAKLEYALSHNDMIGSYNETKLAELVQLYPIPMEIYKISTIVRPIEDVAIDAGVVAPEDRKEDENLTEGERLDTYMHGTIKQIVLFFDNAQYEEVIPRIDALRGAMGVESNTDLFLQMLKITEDYEREHPSSENS